MSTGRKVYPQPNLDEKSAQWAREVTKDLQEVTHLMGMNVRNNYSYFVGMDGLFANAGSDTRKQYEQLAYNKEELDVALQEARDAVAEAVKAFNAAGDAQESADGKNRIWYRDTPPPGDEHNVGDTWFDTGNGNRINEWDGSEWVPVEFAPEALTEDIQQQLQDAAQAAADALEAKDKAQQAINDVFDLSTEQAIIADQARDAWNLAMSGGDEWVNETINPSFESTNNAFLTVPTDNDGNCSAAVSTDWAYEGTQSLKITRNLEYDNTIRGFVPLYAYYTTPTLPKTLTFVVARYVSQTVSYIPAPYVTADGETVKAYFDFRESNVQPGVEIGRAVVTITDDDYPPNVQRTLLPVLTAGNDVGDEVYYDLMTIVEGEYSGPPFSGDTEDAQGITHEWVGLPNASHSVRKSLTDPMKTALAAQNDASRAVIAVTDAVDAANGKNKVFRSTVVPNEDGSAVGDVWWRFSDGNFTGPVIGQWTWSGSIWQPSTIGNEIIESMTVDKLKVTGGAIFESAVVNTLIGQDAFFDSILASRLIVAGNNLIAFYPGEGKPVPWIPIQETEIVQSYSATVGRRYTLHGGSFTNGTLQAAAWVTGGLENNSIPATPGATYSFRARVNKSGTIGTTPLRAQLLIRYTLSDNTLHYDVSDIVGVNWGNTPIEMRSTAPANAVRFQAAICKDYWGDGGGLGVSFCEITTASGATMIEPDAITTEHVRAGTVTAASGILADLAVTNAKIANGTIQNAKIANLDAAKITTGTISAARIGALSIAAGHIAANAVTSEKIAANAVTANAIAAGSIDGMVITGATIRTVASPNARVQMSGNGIRGYNNANTVAYSLTGDGITVNNAGFIVSNAGTAGFGAVGFRGGTLFFTVSSSLEATMKPEANILRHTMPSPSTGTYGYYIHVPKGNFSVNANAITLTANTHDLTLTGSRHVMNLNSTTSGLNVVMTSTGNFIGYQSSSRKYKLAEEPIEETVENFEDKLLAIEAKTWFDKNAVERVADNLTKDFFGKEIEDDLEDVEELRRIPGVIAEDLDEMGLGVFVIYDENGEPMSVMYDRIGVALLPVVSRMKAELNELRSMIENTKD